MPNMLPPNLYLKKYMVTSTARYEVDVKCHITMTANRDGQYYVSIMDLVDPVIGWVPRRDNTQQKFPMRIQAEAWVAMLHKKERQIVELRNSIPQEAKSGTAP